MSPPSCQRSKMNSKLFCDRAIRLLGSHLSPQSSDTETTVVYQKMLADYHRYTAEFTDGDANSKATENAQLAYQESDVARHFRFLAGPIQAVLTL